MQPVDRVKEAEMASALAKRYPQTVPSGNPSLSLWTRALVSRATERGAER